MIFRFHRVATVAVLLTAVITMIVVIAARDDGVMLHVAGQGGDGADNTCWTPRYDWSPCDCEAAGEQTDGVCPGDLYPDYTTCMGACPVDDPICGDNNVQRDRGEECDGGAGCLPGCACDDANTCAGCECQCQIAMNNCMANNNGDGSHCQTELRECYLACNANPAIDKGDNGLCENLCHNDGGGAANTLCPDGLTCCSPGGCIPGDVIDDPECEGSDPPDICFNYTCDGGGGGTPGSGAGAGAGAGGDLGTVAGTGDTTGGETGDTGTSGTTGGSTASRSYSAPSSFSFSIPSSSKKSSSTSAVTLSGGSSTTSVASQGSTSKTSTSSGLSSSSTSSRTSSTVSSASTSTTPSTSSTGSNGSASLSRSSSINSARSSSSTSSSSRSSASSSSRSVSSSSSRSSFSQSSTSSTLTGIGGDDGGTDGGDTGGSTGGSTRSSTSASAGFTSSFSSASSVLIGGICFGTECEFGGDYFCGLFSETCFQTTGFPCIECKATTSSRSSSSRSSRSFSFASLPSFSTASFPYITVTSVPSSLEVSPDLILDLQSPDFCDVLSHCGTTEFCVANECLNEEEVFLLPPFCGNARRDTGEQCDEGSLNSDRPNALCRPDCTIGRCGDTIRDTPLELCDDGNTTNGDGCSSLCQIERGAPTPTEILPATVIELPLTTIIAGVPSNQQNIPSPPRTSDTGPAALSLMVAGASAGYAWMKRRKL